MSNEILQGNANIDKLKYVNIRFKAECYFECLVLLSDKNIEKIKSLIGKNKWIGGNEEQADALRKLLLTDPSIDVMEMDSDVEEIEMHHLDGYPFSHESIDLLATLNVTPS